MISVWEKDTFFAPQDIIIIGSGFSGLWSAFYLKRKNPKLKITITEKGIIPSGASTRNAGFACFGSPSELLADEQQMGTDAMLQLVEMRFKGLRKIQKTFRPELTEMDMCGGYELFLQQQHYHKEELSVLTNYLNQLLLPITRQAPYSLADRHIPQFGFQQVHHLIRNQLEGSLHPAKLIRELCHTVQSLGVQILNGTMIKSIEKPGSMIMLETNHNFTLSARQVLVCVNGFAQQLLPQLDVLPARGQILVTSPIAGLSWKGTFHYKQGFYYFRNIGNRILLGGARDRALKQETTFSQHTTSRIQNELEHFLRTVILPGKKYSIANRWSGTMGTGEKKMPIAEAIAPGIFCCVRMSGMGVALAPVLSEKIATMMTA